MNKISVIVSVYNVAPYIRECLRSIQQQTHQNLEIILVNDGSTDNSGRVCDEFSAMDQRFIVLHKKNGGVSSARNAGLDIASGEYLAFVDPDDYLAHDFYEKLYAALIEYNADLTVSCTDLISESGKPLLPDSVKGLFLGESVSFENNDAVQDGILCNRINCLSWNKLFKRELWGDAHYPVELSLGEDMATVVDVCAGAARAVYCADAVYYYRLRDKSLLHGTVTLERFYEDLQGSEIMRRKLLERAPEKEGAVELLKFFYDVGCYVNYVRSTKHTNEPVKKGSLLYRLHSHIEEFNRCRDVIAK
ncbi:glycosyl transferase family 2 [Clostridia bacterium]|nr:glycosyl transferase family 2 [Clostridia bacterium]GHV32735.1 glycosyl transferase family 2 [Clostridia bacterium]